MSLEDENKSKEALRQDYNNGNCRRNYVDVFIRSYFNLMKTERVSIQINKTNIYYT